MLTPPLVLAVDLGTSCFKAAVFNRQGEMMGLGRVATPKQEGQGQRSELALESFWAALRDAIAVALKCAQAKAGAIAAVSYASQANSFLLLDNEQRALTPLILWPDGRAALVPAERQLEKLWLRADFLSTTGLGMTGPEFCVSKLCWFQRLHPNLWKRCSRILTISDYLVLSLTGLPAGDQATASMLGLWNLPAGSWWEEALETVGIRSQQLARPFPPGTVVGTTSELACDLLALPAGIPFAVGSLDHHAAALGAGICSADDPSISIGTVVACVRYQQTFAPLPGCAMGPGTHRHPFYLLAFDENGTGSVDCYEREQSPDTAIAEILFEADSVGVGSDGLMAYPTPACARTRFSGVEPTHTRGHFVRALMESTAGSVFEIIERLYPDRLPKRMTATGGGTRSDLWLRIVADVSGIEVAVPACLEAACLGAGMLAAVAAGWFDGLADISRAWPRLTRSIKPDPGRHAEYTGWLSEWRARVK